MWFCSVMQPTTKNPRNNHEEKIRSHDIPTKARWYDGTKARRLAMARDPLNLAHSLETND